MLSSASFRGMRKKPSYFVVSEVFFSIVPPGPVTVVVSVFFSSLAAGGLTMVVLFSTFFSSLAGGLTMVVFFSTTGGAPLSTRASQAVKSAATAARRIGVFIFSRFGRNEFQWC